LFREIVDLKRKFVELENKRAKLLKEKLDELASGGNVNFNEVLRVINAEKGVLELLRLKVQEEKENLAKSKRKFQEKIRELRKEKKAVKAVKRGINIALYNIKLHIEMTEKFVDKMLQGLEIVERNLGKIASDNFDLDEDPTPIFEEAMKYLSEEDTCLNNAFEALATVFSDASEKIYLEMLEG